MPKWTEEQQLAIDKENTNVIVSAGAGSGKTAVLTTRVIRKLRSGININQLLILTFTNKAAHEMKERIRNSILEDENLIDQLNYIDGSYITTFDSFALSIVKKYNYLLNVSKNVKIADSSIIYLEKKRIIDEIFDKLYEIEDNDFLSLIDHLTIKDDKDIKKYILDINDKLDLKYDKNEYLDNYVYNYYNNTNLNKLVNEYIQLIKQKINDISTYLEDFSNYVETDYFLEVQDILNPLLESDTYDEIKTNLNIKIPMLKRGSDEQAKEIKKAISDTLDKIEDLARFDSLEEIYDTTKSTIPYINAIIKVINKLDEQIYKFKNDNNIYEFTDISKMAIRVLKENSSVKEELKSFFKEIMIDEYQDTSDLQETFISMIENNNVYMVGDIKQSIYRFRNANPYLFKEKYDNYSKNIKGFKIDLTKNFRSRGEVIDNINVIFSLIMSDELGGADYKSTHKMIFGNKTYIEEGKTNQNNNIEVFNYEYDKSFGYSKEEIEIFFIARDIKEKVESNYQIFDKDKKVLRNASYKDFAILLDKSSNFDLYKKIFEYLNIPMTKYTSTNITNEIEIVLIKNILKLIICKRTKNYDVEFKYAFTSIARSYLFSYSDNDIFNIHVSGNYFDNEIMNKVVEIANISDGISLKELIYLIVDKFDFYSKQISVGDVKNRSNRIMAIINIFDNLSAIGYDIENCLNYLEKLIEDNYKLEVKEIDSLEDSVTIMTIHASKGLEFPICYFASLHSLFNIRELNEKFLCSNKYGIIAPFYKEGIGTLFVKNLVRENYINEEISEKIRLFYVALTRAKEKMIMVTSFNLEKKVSSLANSRSFLDMLSYIYSDIEKYVSNISIDKLKLTKDYNLIKKYNYKDCIESTTDTLLIKEFNVSKNNLSKNKISKSVDLVIDKKTREYIEFGKMIHQVLEFIDFKNPNFDCLDISLFYKKKIEEFINLITKDKVLNLYKEYEFMYQDGNIYQHGIIDLIVEYDDRLSIIDYKLKNLVDDNYIKQLNNYKKYIATKTNKKIDIYLFSIVDGILEKVDSF